MRYLISTQDGVALLLPETDSERRFLDEFYREMAKLGAYPLNHMSLGQHVDTGIALELYFDRSRIRKRQEAKRRYQTAGSASTV